MTKRGLVVGALHGDPDQGAREQVLRVFHNGKVGILVATDVAARGISVDNITHVTSYQRPEDERTYIHHTDHTGRAGQSGTTATFVDWGDLPRWTLIDRALNLRQPEPLGTYHTSERLCSDPDIPEGTTGRLPRDRYTRAGLTVEYTEDLGGMGRRNGKGYDGSHRGWGRGSSSGPGKRPSGQHQHEQAQRRGQSRYEKPVKEDPQATPRRSRQRKKTRRTDESRRGPLSIWAPGADPRDPKACVVADRRISHAVGEALPNP